MVWGATVLGDGQTALSWSFDASLRLWDLATGRQKGDALKRGF